MVDTTTLWILTLVYAAITMYLGYLGYKKTKVTEDFMLAGRKVHPWIIGFSYGATFISTSAIVGFGGISAIYGMGLIWLAMLNIGVGVLLAFIVFGRKTRELGQKLQALTFPHLLSKQFNSPFMQYATAVVILVAMPLYSAAVLLGGATFIKTTLAIDLNTALLGFALIVTAYVVFGGLRGVMYTDALQGAIMLVGMAVLLILTFNLLGGPAAALNDLTALPSEVPSSMIEGMIAKGFTGWTSMPAVGSEYWLVLVTTIIMGVGIGVLAQPQLVVRFMTAADNRALARAVPIGGVFILLTTGVIYTVGPLTNLYFFRTTGGISLLAAEGNADEIIPLFINSAMPDLFVVVFMLVLLSAAMSTLSSIFHTMGTTAGFDIWAHVKRWRQKAADIEAPSMVANKVGTMVMIFFSVVLALMMPFSIIARATAMFMGLCACAFLPAFVHGLFSKAPSVLAAKVSVTVGGISWFLWTAFVHIKESSILGLSQALFGQPAVLGMPWQVVDPLVIALPLSIIALVVTWALDRTRAEEEIPVNGRSGSSE